MHSVPEYRKKLCIYTLICSEDYMQLKEEHWHVVEGICCTFCPTGVIFHFKLGGLKVFHLAIS